MSGPHDRFTDFELNQLRRAGPTKTLLLGPKNSPKGQEKHRVNHHKDH